MDDTENIPDSNRGAYVVTLCEQAAEAWADGAEHVAERYVAAAMTLLGNGRLADQADR